ncbi:uncharacterized protein LOC126881237 [Diabrotica virgifera virgifera]|uniref:Protein TsetseEP-like n=1 Tax=Diabrotica virgifera virgifera TaxID=50390 RepID=A0ABM5JTT4_DIAVI|nr:uncharacterized protein LOC126881237 [Diabrotica virgifera virgifera]
MPTRFDVKIMKNILFLSICGLLICHVFSASVEKRVERKNIVKRSLEAISTIKQTTGEIVQKVKTGVKVAKCALHTVGDKIYSHSHQIDPCTGRENAEGKSSDGGIETQNKVPNTDTSTLIDVRMKQDSKEEEKVAARTIIVRANCPEGFLADAVGTCREVY